MNARIEITDTTGRVWLSDPDVDGELDDEMREQLRELLTDWPKLNYLSLEIGSTMTYFNPANIIAVRIVDPAPATADQEADA